jgi:quinol monooxygenase YgiN
MADAPIIINAHIQAASGREAELRQQLQSLVAPSRREPGCLAYALHIDPQDPGKFMFYEKFASQAAIDSHLATPHFVALLSYLKNNEGLIASQTVTHWRDVDSEG